MFYRRIAQGLRRRAEADACSTGSTGVMQLVRNPLAPGPDAVTTWMRQTPFTLGELREWIPEPLMTLTGQRPHGDGRNVDVFAGAVKASLQGEWPRKLAEDGPTSPAWENEVQRHAIEQSPDAPLLASEVRSIARSTARYAVENWRADWRNRRLPQLQARRGRKGGQASGEARRQATADRDQAILEARVAGATLQSIADQFDISLKAVHHVVNRDKKFHEAVTG